MIPNTTVSDLFRSNGAKIVAEESVFAENLKSIKALIFDWDGVFNEGWKGDNVLSPFSEVDSMGINMLRFALWLKSGSVPQVFIVTGLKNLSAQAIANREGFTALYLEVMNKSKAVEHIEENYKVTQKEMICFFDDILDIPMVKNCALRMFIHRKSNPLFERYVVENKLCDYVTGTESGKPAIREACEFLLGMGGMYDEAISKRISFSDEFKQFMSERKEIKPSLFRFNGTDIEPYQA